MKTFKQLLVNLVIASGIVGWIAGFAWLIDKSTDPGCGVWMIAVGSYAAVSMAILVTIREKIG